LLKPTDRAAQVCTVDRKNLKLITGNVPHPASCIHGFAVGRHHVGIPEGGQSRLAFGKIAQGTKRNP
jgi:hypothetical protein